MASGGNSQALLWLSRTHFYGDCTFLLRLEPRKNKCDVVVVVVVAMVKFCSFNSYSPCDVLE
jgi:hypothetical protein